MAEHVCPYWAGYFLANRLRKLLQNPYKILTPYVRPGMTALDVGSAMGFFSLPMAQMVGPGGKVICIDVQPKMLQVLCRRATEAGLAERIETHVSAEDSTGLHGRDAVFDFALAFTMLHEVGNQANFLREIYQLLKPARPGLRGGWVTVETWLDGTRHIRFQKTELAYHQIGPAGRRGALPPGPRSLSHGRTPAEPGKKEGPAALAARPSAVRPAPGRSGRTPAEPCPPEGKQSLPPATTPSPRPGQAWMRNFRLPGSNPKRGHSYPPKTADISIRH